jgi:hypothetical protein
MNCMLVLLRSHRQGPRRNTALAKQRNGNQKKLIGSGAGCKYVENAAHKPKM